MVTRMQDATVSNAEAVDGAISSRLREVNTAIPAIVQSFDASTGRISVRPAIDKVVDGSPRQHALISDVPVMYLAGGGFSVVHPLADGDLVTLLVSQNGMSDFKRRLAQGADPVRSMPNRRVNFRLQDAIAIPGLLTGDALDIPADALDIRTGADGLVTVNGEDGWRADGMPIARVDVPIQSTAYWHYHTGWSAIAGAPAGFRVDDDAVVVTTAVRWPRNATGVLVRAMSTAGVEYDRVAFRYKPSGTSEMQMLHVNGTRESAMRVQYGGTANNPLAIGDLGYGPVLLGRNAANQLTVQGTGGVDYPGRFAGLEVYAINADGTRGNRVVNWQQSITNTYTLPNPAWTIPASGSFEVSWGAAQGGVGERITRITAEHLRSLNAKEAGSNVHPQNAGDVIVLPMYPYFITIGNPQPAAGDIPLSIRGFGTITTAIARIEVSLMINGGVDRS